MSAYTIQEDVIQGIHITVFSSFEEIAPFWSSFEQSADLYAFQKLIWLKNWYSAVTLRDTLKLTFILVESSAHLPLMLLPLCVSSTGPISRLTWLGGRLTDYHAPLLYKGFSSLIDKEHFIRLWKDIVRLLPVCDVIDLQKQPKFIGDQINPFYHLNIRSHASCAHYTRLSGDINQFLASKRSNRWISNENRKMRNLSKQGTLRFREITTQRELSEYLPVMLRQKSDSYHRMGTEDIFADNEYRNFVRTISENHLADGFVRFFVLMLGDSVIATHWGLLYRNRLYSLLPTYDYGELNKFSPGTILFRYLFEWCIAHKVEIFDFTTGDEPYKDLWCDQELPLFDYLVPTTARGLLYTPLVKVWRRAKTSIKKTPFFYEVAKKLRKNILAVSRRNH